MSNSKQVKLRTCRVCKGEIKSNAKGLRQHVLQCVKAKANEGVADTNYLSTTV